MEYDPIRFSTANIIVSGTVLFQFVVIVIEETFCIDAFMYASYWLFTYSSGLNSTRGCSWKEHIPYVT